MHIYYDSFCGSGVRHSLAGPSASGSSRGCTEGVTWYRHLAEISGFRSAGKGWSPSPFQVLLAELSSSETVRLRVSAPLLAVGQRQPSFIAGVGRDLQHGRQLASIKTYSKSQLLANGSHRPLTNQVEVTFHHLNCILFIINESPGPTST